MKNKYICADDIEVTEDMKEAFEVYWYHHGDMDDHDIYESQEWVTFRCAWKASRESLVVEIPKEGEASSFGHCVVFDTDAVKEMLDKAGVSYE